MVETANETISLHNLINCQAICKLLIIYFKNKIDYSRSIEYIVEILNQFVAKYTFTATIQSRPSPFHIIVRSHLNVIFITPTNINLMKNIMYFLNSYFESGI